MLPKVAFPRSRSILAALALLVAGGGGVYWYLQNQQAQAVFFSKALNDANVTETVSIGGTSYEVNRGVVTQGGSSASGGKALQAMRLAYQLASARRLPLLGLEGTDHEALARGTEALAQIAEELATVLPEKTKPYEAAVRGSLYPIQFLRALSAVESARQEFLADGRGGEC